MKNFLILCILFSLLSCKEEKKIIYRCMDGQETTNYELFKVINDGIIKQSFHNLKMANMLNVISKYELDMYLIRLKYDIEMYYVSEKSRCQIGFYPTNYVPVNFNKYDFSNKYTKENIKHLELLKKEVENINKKLEENNK